MQELDAHDDEFEIQLIDGFEDCLLGCIYEEDGTPVPCYSSASVISKLKARGMTEDEAVGELFDTLDWLEDRLSNSRYLMGDRVTEADWRLYPTLARFDEVYHGHFKCNRRRIVDYPNLWAYARELYQWPGIAATTQPAHYIRHYHYSHESINPHRIVPIGPVLDWTAPHRRDAM